MGLFLSTYINKVDKKGRVSVPAQFRDCLVSEEFQGVVLFKSYTHQAVDAVGMEAMEKFANRMDDNFAIFSDTHHDMATILFGESMPCAFDGDGRITLPKSFAEFAGITTHVAFVGLGKTFQLWSPELFEYKKSSARQSLQENKITLPKGHGDGS